MAATKPKPHTAIVQRELNVRVNPRRFAQKFATAIESHLFENLKSVNASNAQRIRRLLVQTLETSLVSEAAESANTDARYLPRQLPVADLTPSEVIARGLVNMSPSTLYRAAESGRFYSITFGGRAHGRLFPEWQFIEPVPSVLPRILALLQQYAESERHAVLVSEKDELNELSPAEVIAGLPFETRGPLENAQQRLLRMPTQARWAEVEQVLKQPFPAGAVG